MAAFVGEFVSLPRRRPDRPKGILCDLCGRRYPKTQTRPLSDGEHICRRCDTDDGEDWHATDWWIRNRPEAFPRE